MKIKNLSWIAALALIVPFRTASAETATMVGSDSCIACHSEAAASFNGSLHGKKMPIVQKMGADKTCESCHGAGSLHVAAGGDKTNPGFATIKNPAKTDSKEAAKTCFTCHKQKELILWPNSSHAQSGMSCAKCHSVHQGQGPKNLRKTANETCFQCHAKQKADLKLASRHPLEDNKMLCVSCHNPHGGPNGNLKEESIEETCFKCHSEKAGPFAHEHPPVAEGCAVCHKPHGSVNEAMLKQPQPYLCMRCHKWPHVERNITGGTNALRPTGIVQRQRCTDCHREIHGSDRKGAFKD